MRTRFTLLGGAFLALAACQMQETPASPEAQPSPATGVFADANACESAADAIANEINISATPVPLASDEADRTLPAGISFAGGWHLTSDNASFGGLSGIEILPDGNLLTVADDGAFVWIDLAEGVPSGSGRIAYMHGADGNLLQGKENGDSEGLALKDGVAYVSFERNHRIEAFALEACGPGAKAQPVTQLPETFDGRRIGENDGAEALAWTPELEAGIEALFGGLSPTVRFTDTGPEITLLEPPGPEYDHPVVGMANALTVSLNGAEETWVYRLRRNYNPLFGNTLAIEVRQTNSSGTSQTGLFVLKRPMNVDNFEGITASVQPDGTHRLWLVADNNFSDRQRTLLFAFDIDAAAAVSGTH